MQHEKAHLQHTGNIGDFSGHIGDRHNGDSVRNIGYTVGHIGNKSRHIGDSKRGTLVAEIGTLVTSRHNGHIGDICVSTRWEVVCLQCVCLCGIITVITIILPAQSMLDLLAAFLCLLGSHPGL